MSNKFTGNSGGDSKVNSTVFIRVSVCHTYLSLYLSLRYSKPATYDSPSILRL